MCLNNVKKSYMDIYFIRHTKVAVPAGTCYGRTDVPLLDSFEEEAEAVRRQLEGLTFEAVYSSPLTRARRLAAYCGYPDATVDARVCEMDFGLWEMQPFDRLYAEDARFAVWCDNYLTASTPEGEGVADVTGRLSSFINEKIRMHTGPIAVFCHGGILALARILLGGISPEESFKNIPPYGSVIHLVV